MSLIMSGLEWSLNLFLFSFSPSPIAPIGGEARLNVEWSPPFLQGRLRTNLHRILPLLLFSSFIFSGEKTPDQKSSHSLWARKEKNTD